MPDRALCGEIKKVLQTLQETDTIHYLKQALECFGAGAYDAAIVMAWSATIAHLVRKINRIGPEVFRYAYRKAHPDRKKVPNSPQELVGDDDNAFVEVCGQMRFLRFSKDELHRFRDRRNKSAHPTSDLANKNDAIRYLGLCLKTVGRPGQDVFILDETLLVDYALKGGHAAETIADLVHPGYRLSAAIKVMEAYLSNSRPEYDALVEVWRRLWGLLNESDRRQLWRKIAAEAVRVLKNRNDFRNSEELARFIVWPVPSQKHLYRDFIASQYIADLKRKVQDGTFSSKDKDFALWLYERLPKEFQRQIVHLCTRWLVSRVRKGNFDGSDLDFNAWLKEQSDPSHRTRFQVIRDAIMRRYCDDPIT